MPGSPGGLGSFLLYGDLGAVPPTFSNLSFEVAGAAPGFALAWSWTHYASAIVIAGYGTPEQPWESFEREWNTNEAYKFAFQGFTVDLTQELFASLAADNTKTVENFEEFWSSNEGYRFGRLDDAVAALFDSSPEPFEDFEENWFSNESYKFAFTGIGTDLTAATFDAGAHAYENFEGTWTAMTTI